MLTIGEEGGVGAWQMHMHTRATAWGLLLSARDLRPVAPQKSG